VSSKGGVQGRKTRRGLSWGARKGDEKGHHWVVFGAICQLSTPGFPENVGSLTFEISTKGHMFETNVTKVVIIQFCFQGRNPVLSAQTFQQASATFFMKTPAALRLPTSSHAGKIQTLGSLALVAASVASGIEAARKRESPSRRTWEVAPGLCNLGHHPRTRFHGTSCRVRWCAGHAQSRRGDATCAGCRCCYFETVPMPRKSSQSSASAAPQ